MLDRIDGYSGFNTLFENGEASQVACMAHIRRKFVDVQPSTGAEIAEEVIRRITEIYAVKAEVRGKLSDERKSMR